MLPCTLFEFDVHSEAACILNVCPSILDTYIYTYCYILLYIRLPPAEETMPFWMMMMMMMMMMVMMMMMTQVAQCQDHLRATSLANPHFSSFHLCNFSTTAQSFTATMYVSRLVFPQMALQQ